jgi:RimJ/RimL family protein N-acetyltransferase
VRVLLDRAFGELGLRRVYRFVLASNERAVSTYRRCGFVEEGGLRCHAWKRGAPVDVLVMGCLAEERW